MKILVLEDRSPAMEQIEEYLTDLFGYEVTVCPTCTDFLDEMNCNDFDHYIVDLNVPAEGLSEEEVVKTQGGLLTGWFLLTNYILLKDTLGPNKTIIFSDFINKLEEYANSKHSSENEKLLFIHLMQRKAIITKAAGYPPLGHYFKK